MPLLVALEKRNVAVPLLLLNLVLYTFMVGFASSALSNFIGGQQHHPGLRGNDATLHFVQFAVLAGVVGVAAKLAAAYHHARGLRPQGLAVAASLGTVAWAATALAFGLACKEMSVGGGGRGWRLRALEGLAATLAFTQLPYVAMLHANVAGGRHGGLGCSADDDRPRAPPCSIV